MVSGSNLLFNLEKCSVTPMGKGNQEPLYEMGGKVLKMSEDERGFEVIMQTTV